jgi:hypothetical protein
MADFGQNSQPVLPMNPVCTYQSDIATFFNINFYLESLFQDHAGVAPEALGGTRDSFPLGGNLSNTTIESKFKNISNSMANHIRQNGQPINSPLAAVRDLCACSLGWLTFPAALFAFTLMFFVGKAVETMSKCALLIGSHCFKSSALPLDFCGVEADLPQIFWKGEGGMKELIRRTGRSMLT